MKLIDLMNDYEKSIEIIDSLKYTYADTEELRYTLENHIEFMKQIINIGIPEDEELPNSRSISEILQNSKDIREYNKKLYGTENYEEMKELQEEINKRITNINYIKGDNNEN